MPKRYNTPHRSRVVKTRLSEDESVSYTHLDVYKRQTYFCTQKNRRTGFPIRRQTVYLPNKSLCVPVRASVSTLSLIHISNLEQAFDTKPLSYKEEKVKLSHFDITFENVDFSYNQQTDVLHNISFHAPEGSTTALIGPSGSGKSTVANLIARFWDVTKGCVRIEMCIRDRSTRSNP